MSVHGVFQTTHHGAVSRLEKRIYHPQNNPEAAGGPETVMVAQVHAMSEAEAVERAFEQGVTGYPGQRVWAEKV